MLPKKPNGSMMKSEFFNPLRQMKVKTQPQKIYEMQQKQFLEGSSQWYSFPLKRQEKSQIKKPNLGSLKELEKEEQIKPKVRRRKEIIKVREEINKMEIKKK